MLFHVGRLLMTILFPALMVPMLMLPTWFQFPPPGLLFPLGLLFGFGRLTVPLPFPGLFPLPVPGFTVPGSVSGLLGRIGLSIPKKSPTSPMLGRVPGAGFVRSGLLGSLFVGRFVFDRSGMLGRVVGLSIMPGNVPGFVVF